MNISPKKTIICFSLITLLSVVLSSFSVNAAKFEVEKGELDKRFSNGEVFDWSKEAELNKSTFFDDMVDFRQFQESGDLASNYQLVLELILKKQYKQAKEKVISFIQEEPSQPIYYNLKASLEIQEKDLSAAKQSYKKAIGIDSSNAQAYVGLSAIALEEEQFTIANQYANKALEQSPYQVSAYIILSKIAMQQQGGEAAEKQLLNANLKVKGNFKAELTILKLLANDYIRRKQPEKVLPLAQNLVERNKTNTIALSFLASAFLANQDLVGAENILRQIIVLDAKDVKHVLALARLVSKQAEKEAEVLQLLDQAALHIKNPTSVLALRTAYLIKQEKYQQAHIVAKQVDDDNPKLSLGKILKGDVFLNEKKYDKAVQAYRQAYQIENNTKVLDAMLKILVMQNKEQEAISFLKKELATNKDNMVIQSRLATLHQNLGQYDLSAQYYEALLEKQSDNTILLNNLAWVYGQQGSPKALVLAEKAFKKAPKSAVVADTYGYILLKNGKLQESLKVLKLAAVMAPNVDEIQLHLAEAYIANQNKSEARKILEPLLNKDGSQKAKAIKLMEHL